MLCHGKVSGMPLSGRPQRGPDGPMASAARHSVSGTGLAQNRPASETTSDLYFSHSIMTELETERDCRILSQGVGQPEMP